MSVRTLGILSLSIISVILAGCSQLSTEGRAWQDVLISPLSDPLLVTPPVLSAGPLLPGGGAMPECKTGLRDGHQITLHIAIDLALCNNTQIKSAWIQIKIASAAKGISRATYLPTITGSLGRSYSNTQSKDSIVPTSTDISRNTVYGNMVWRLFDFGGRNANRLLSEANLQSAMLSQNAVIQKSLASTVAVFFDTQTAKMLLESKILDESYALQILNTAKRRESFGLASINDRLQIEAALEKTSLERARAKNQLSRLTVNLLYTVGVDPSLVKSSDISGDFSSILDSISETPQTRFELNNWVKDIQRNHPAILAVQQDLVAAKEKVRSVRSEYLPTIDFNGNYFKNGRPNQNLTLVPTTEVLAAINLNIPIFDGFTKGYQIQNALAQVEKKEVDLQEVQRFIVADFVNSFADFEVSLDTLAIAKRLLSTAQASLESNIRKLSVGATDISDALRALSVLSDAMQQLIQTIAENRSAKLRLLANSAQLGRKPELNF